MKLLFILSFSPWVTGNSDMPEFVQGDVWLSTFLDTSHFMHNSLAAIAFITVLLIVIAKEDCLEICVMQFSL